MDTITPRRGFLGAILSLLPVSLLARPKPPVAYALQPSFRKTSVFTTQQIEEMRELMEVQTNAEQREKVGLLDANGREIREGDTCRALRLIYPTRTVHLPLSSPTGSSLGTYPSPMLDLTLPPSVELDNPDAPVGIVRWSPTCLRWQLEGDFNVLTIEFVKGIIPLGAVTSVSPGNPLVSRFLFEIIDPSR